MTFGPKPRHNWTLIRQEYVEGVNDEKGGRSFPTYKELGIRHGCHKITVARKAQGDDWLLDRKLYASRVATEREAKTAALLGEKAAAFDETNLKLAKALQGRIAQLLGQEVTGKISAGRLLAIAGVLERAQRVGRLALGDSTSTFDVRGSADGITDAERAHRIIAILERARDRRAGSVDEEPQQLDLDSDTGPTD